jgi:predicted nucleotide-binding protein
MRVLAVTLLLSGCAELDELLNPEKIGAYTCDEYCEQVLDKTGECAQEQADAACAADPQACKDFSDEDLAAFAAQGNPDWEGKNRQQMVDDCNVDIADKDDAACQAETATLNNLSCDDILSLIGNLGG